jgi:hypothetical protein
MQFTANSIPIFKEIENGVGAPLRRAADLRPTAASAKFAPHRSERQKQILKQFNKCNSPR